MSAKTVFNEYKNGELFKKRENNASGNPIWTLNSRNARGQITSATLGNNLIAQTNTYHDLGYTLQTKHDKLGTPNVNIMTLDNTFDLQRRNMLTRNNSLFAWNETFGYDNLDRLTNFTNKLGAQTTQEYENNGKIKNNFLGNYRYSTAKPYQNTAIKLTAEGLLEPGIMQTQTIVYSAFKAPLSIVQGSQRTFFGYNFAQDRSVMYFGNSNTNKLLQPKRRFYSADGTMEITMTLATATLPASYEFTTYIGGDAYTAPALDRQVNNASSSIFYLHRDHLGTILALTNSLGDVVEKRLFDAWGDIVKVQNGAGVAQTRLLFLDRGYTGHEHLQSFRLINMNGRLYDPRLHRFLQPDNNLQEPDNTQNYNRYAYCVNNPLKYTDPSGESFWTVVGYVLSTYILTANANGGELKPTKWTANSILNAVSGIASSFASAGASYALNKFVDNYGNHPAIGVGEKNVIEEHTYAGDFGNAVVDNINPINIGKGIVDSVIAPFKSGYKIAEGGGDFTDWLNMGGVVGQSANMAIGIYQTGEAAASGDGYAAGSLVTQVALILLTKKFSKGAAVVENVGTKSFSSMMGIEEAARYNKYWQKYAPKQISPNTKRLDWKRISGRTGRIENSRVIYDKAGRMIYRVDYTDHLRPLEHSNPHLHQRIYSPFNKDGIDYLFNF